VERVPIACTLSVDDGSSRLEEWRQFLQHHVIEIDRLSTSARLRLSDDDQAVLAATDLARREKACCAFFDFRLVLLSEAVWLEVEAPEEAAPFLDGLVGNLGRT
jgi:hypothetical protein